MKSSETNVKAYPRHNFYKKKVWNDPRYYYKEILHNKKKPRVTNTKGPIRLWVPKSEIVFADMLNGKDKTFVLISGQWMTTTYNKRKACVPNPNSERGGKVGVWRKEEKYYYGC